MRHIYVHGLGQTAASWDEVISYLNDAEENICPDLTEMIRDKEVSYTNLYSAFSDVCNETGESIKLCGLSLGGVLALNYAIDHPERVNSLVLIATQYKMPQRMLRFQNMIFRFMPDAMFRQMGFGKREFIRLCSTMMELDFSQSVSRISCPVLVACGEKDGANKRASRELASLLENVELQSVKEAGHEVNSEAPEQLAKLLEGFYERIS